MQENGKLRTNISENVLTAPAIASSLALSHSKSLERPELLYLIIWNFKPNEFYYTLFVQLRILLEQI